MNGADLGIGQCVTLACVWEATAAKPGNVYRGADFADTSFADFLTSAVRLGPVLQNAREASVGELILRAVETMRTAVRPNTHLGTILLLAPLAKAATQSAPDLPAAAGRVAAATTKEDCRLAYQAIRLVSPGGLGDAAEADVSAQPVITLASAMHLAASHDLVARQYGNGYAEVALVAQQLQEAATRRPLGEAIVVAYLQQMARDPDSLIARKCGQGVAQESADRAGATLAARDSGASAYHRALAELDFWLRGDGNRRNPGTTADLIAAALFVLLAEDRLAWPIDFQGLAHA